MQTPDGKYVVVNADDFGFSPEVTEGILRAHREGIVTSTTVVANMPAAGDAVARLAEVPQLGVGVHLNVSQGPPLSAAGRRLAGAGGVMARSAVGVVLACATRPWLLDAVEAEFDAQVRWLLARGVRATHLDSHRHVHAFPTVFPRVLRLARRYDIPAVRWACEALPGGGWPVAEARQRFVARAVTGCHRLSAVLTAGRRLRACRGTWGLAHTGRIDAAWLVRAAGRVRPGAWEIMTHPGLGGGAAEPTRLTASRRAELDALCDPRVRAAFDSNGVQRVHYGHLARGNLGGEAPVG
jgi:predicted glycoside hydrolase/deacetylase ChbG (UPF0249 family)